MDVLAFIFAVVALIIFLGEGVQHNRHRRGVDPHTTRVNAVVPYLLPFGLAFLTLAWICQATSITDNLVNF